MDDEQAHLEERLVAAEQALRDERAERDAAQRRGVELSSRADLWRSRAEDRAARIRQLEAERDQLRSPQGWVRARLGRLRPAPGEAAAAASPIGAETQLPPRRPALPVVRAAALVDGGPVSLLLDESDTVDLAVDPAVLQDSDVVVVDASAAVRRPEAMASLLDWLELPARQPLILVWSDDALTADEPARTLADRAEMVLSDAGSVRARWGDRVKSVPSTFDPAVFNPVGRTFAPVTDTDREAQGSFVRRVDASGRTMAVDAPPTWCDDAPPWLVELAAAGIPVISSEAGDVGRDELSRSGAAARRWAYREHDPAVALARLLTSVGLSVPAVNPVVCGLLVSRRPEDLPASIAGFVAQRYLPKELVIGCHGFPSTQIEDALQAVGDLSVRVIEFDSTIPLGECLNEAAALTGAGVLAKIDDDDYYGPGYLEDAIQALRYSRSRIVGKATQFTYLEEDDITVLRRGGSEETTIDGAVTGASLVFDRSVWEAVRFPHRPRRVDALFLSGARRVGESVYANSRWDFVYRRRGSGHTWDVAPDAFAAEAVPAWDGWHPERSDA